MGIILMGWFLTVPVEAGVLTKRAASKKAVELNLDIPMIEIVAKAYGKSIDAGDIVRVQKIMSQIDHITVTFKDPEAVDYVLKFKQLNEQELEAWMVKAGYLSTDIQASISVEPTWMQDMAMHFE